MFGKTRQLRGGQEGTDIAVREVEAFDRTMPQPWRILLRIMHVQVCQIFNLTGRVIIGRTHDDSDRPDIDLQPFKAFEMAVSRQHLELSLQDNAVVAKDCSSQGTWLNGNLMEPGRQYPLRHGDKVKLGLMMVQIEFLMNPFDMRV